MREILFRGQDTESSEWVYGYYAHFENLHDVEADIIYTGYADVHMGCLLPEYYDVIPETVGQYTGLTDKNGKKVFEGDVIECDVFFKKEKLVVKYYAGAFSFSNGKEIIPFNDSEYGIVNVNGIIDGILIGNIYDNPELIGRESNG